ncbi:hypothetical protein [Alkalicoccus chagannorensis]|uniref:hypothetical protein n=1 Tax=Alkalicoccus chagannorensis TaxID=427072 RepID=UPI00041E524C|nr:hypothetical protein [Alkalicoccus chagannorensis]
MDTLRARYRMHSTIMAVSIPIAVILGLDPWIFMFTTGFIPTISILILPIFLALAIFSGFHAVQRKKEMHQKEAEGDSSS